ncbi:MAG TPA: glycosyltransferase family 39 protein [Aggregatilineales bacterium]|nr:glycosyltransferase family 39 protein [Aggregatilineales bacterium]
MIGKASPARLRDLIFLNCLLFYVLSGMMLAPFHGDEATTIYQSKDWYRITNLATLSTVFYRPKIDDPRLSDEQEFRLQNGVISKYAIGLFASLLGQPIEAMNDPWFWGADYNDNLSHGHLPNGVVLLAARFSSTVMLMLSTALVFKIGWMLRGRWAAWTASFVYATLPSVLLNGRRAMFEGATLLGVALVIFAALVLAQLCRKYAADRLWRNWILFGLACGFGIASKHTLLIIVAPAFLALLVTNWRSVRHWLNLAIAALTALALFLLLNPAWWTAPLLVPGVVLHLREGVLQAQVAIYGGYQNTQDRLVALARYPLGSAQYFEDKQNWVAWIGDQISNYERSYLGGIDWNGWPVYLLSIVGTASLLQKRALKDIIFAFIAIFAILALLLATPLPWQRYYLPLAAFWAIIAGIGVDMIRRLGQNACSLLLVTQFPN